MTSGNKYNALLIGCGKIGALYDFDTPEIQTHAKGYIHNGNFNLHVYDKDESLAKRVAGKYNAVLIDNPEEINFSGYDCISICTPTDLHFNFLEKGLRSKTKLLICEKPVSYSPSELDRLEDLYRDSSCKILVNYIRRFQPSYHLLREKYRAFEQEESPQHVLIKYYRGFLNNCSHAADTLQFLSGKDSEWKNVVKHQQVFDAFPNDPTLSLSATWNNCHVEVEGCSNCKEPVFEIHITFQTKKISITESGNCITIFAKTHENGNWIQEEKVNNCLQNYMEPVMQVAAAILSGKSTDDNFQEAVTLNRNFLNLLNN